ncbi:MAG: hypothetical protein RLY21_2540 [Planctomycetota bacterium]
MTTNVVTVLSLASGMVCSPALAVQSATGANDDLRRALDEIDVLRKQNEALAAKVGVLEERVVADGDWLTEQRAQEIRAIVTDVLADSVARESLAADGATAGYDKSKGFFLASADGNYTLGMKGDVQIRWAYNSRDIGSAPAAQGSPSNSTADDAWGFELRRVRLTFFGNVIDPTWDYEIKFAFNRNATASNNGFLDEAFVTKDLGQGWSLRAGQFKVPFLREELVTSTAQLAVERSLVNDFFSAQKAQGLRLGWQNEQFKVEGYYGDAIRANGASPYAITTGGIGALNAGAAQGVPTSQNTSFNGVPTDYAFAARAEWKPLGEWKQFRDMQSYRGEGQGVLLGVAGYAEQVDPVPATNGATPDVVLSATADASFDFGGASIFAYGVYRNVTLQSAQAVRGGGTNDEINQWGAVFQGGYFVADDVEVFARYEIGDSDDDQYRTQATSLLASGQDLSVVTVGMNWWIAGVKNKQVKWTTDFGYSFEPVVDFAASGANYLPDYTASGGETNDGQWVVRSQFQFMF